MATPHSLLLTLGLLFSLSQLHSTLAALYKVGDFSGKWGTDNYFQAGDSLSFGNHTQSADVHQVSREDYKACETVKPIRTYRDGNNVAHLKEQSTYYFISGAKSQCNGGRKLMVVVLAGAPGSASPASPPAVATPPPAATPPPVSSPPPAAKAPTPSTSTPPPAVAPVSPPPSTPPPVVATPPPSATPSAPPTAAPSSPPTSAPTPTSTTPPTSAPSPSSPPSSVPSPSSSTPTTAPASSTSPPGPPSSPSPATPPSPSSASLRDVQAWIVVFAGLCSGLWLL